MKISDEEKIKMKNIILNELTLDWNGNFSQFLLSDLQCIASNIAFRLFQESQKGNL
jgi:hypothetical protein